MEAHATAFVERIGERTLKIGSALYEALRFAALCLAHMVTPGSYHPAMRRVLVRQIYFTAVEILPLFVSVGVLFGSVIVGTIVSLAVHYGLQGEIGTILVAFVMHEFAPFFTVMLVSLRSGTAINTEIAVMQVNRELDTLKAFRIDVIDYLFLPRILGGVVSIVLLSALFGAILFASGYLFSLFYLRMELELYLHTIIQAINISDFVIMVAKSTAFAFFATLIPIYSGLKTEPAMTGIPISVLNGMVKLFVAISLIEVFSLLMQSL